MVSNIGAFSNNLLLLRSYPEERLKEMISGPIEDLIPQENEDLQSWYNEVFSKRFVPICTSGQQRGILRTAFSRAPEEQQRQFVKSSPLQKWISVDQSETERLLTVIPYDLMIKYYSAEDVSFLLSWMTTDNILSDSVMSLTPIQVLTTLAEPPLLPLFIGALRYNRNSLLSLFNPLNLLERNSHSMILKNYIHDGQLKAGLGINPFYNTLSKVLVKLIKIEIQTDKARDDEMEKVVKKAQEEAIKPLAQLSQSDLKI